MIWCRDHVEIRGFAQELHGMKMPKPSSRISMLDSSVLVEGPESQAASGIFVGAAADVWRFDPLIDCIADKTCKRIFDRLNDRPLQFGVLAMNIQLNFRVIAQSQIANGTRKLVPDIAARQHARH